ncbi:WD40 repeat-like protein [Microthyrium microscopicum]|uniref:WD40 repeat-like protein n=1 Tax=Microthyrium microscopicum TaxID=703497 RepID=A0A6A6U940_9PEZI|nr:WD40 repeat-like protein [Microthyrium microscopicum]
MNAASSDSVNSVSDGRGGYMTSGSNAPLYSANFFASTDPATERDMHERRLALALDIDPSTRLFSPSSPSSGSGSLDNSPEQGLGASGKLVWKNNEWNREGSITSPLREEKKKKAVPIIPFRVLNAPALRDDFYCSVLAYSHSAKVLAVGLGNTVYFWNESGGVESPPNLNPPSSSYVSCLSFSSRDGGKGILAAGRSNGHVVLHSPHESQTRFDIHQPSPICCVAFRPTSRSKDSMRDRYISVKTEDLLIGDEAGHVYFYSVEWPTETERDLFDFRGCVTLIVRLTMHTQQICGIAWAPDGDTFATGGNDNLCHLCDTRRVIAEGKPDTAHLTSSSFPSFNVDRQVDLTLPHFNISALFARHCFTVAAAVKAIAFCPWQRGLLAISGGSNDRRIHFFHTLSGATLATVDCHAQVTSLVWSTSRREIAATFGFAQPEHPYRIAVFKWPSCEIVVKIPWFDEHRALFAIPYPGGPNISRSHEDSELDARGRDRRGRARSRSGLFRSRDWRREGGLWWSRTEEEGCLVVATSDCSIKFHEVWAEERRATGERGGMLGGSDILDLIHGIERDDGEIIR